MRSPQLLILRYLLAVLLTIFPALFSSLLTPLTFTLTYVLAQTLFGATLNGIYIVVGGKNFEFIPACTAVLAYVLLAVLILVTRGINLKKGILMFATGSMLILVANVIRIEFLLYIFLTNGIDYFQTLHLLIWKILSTIYVVIIWIFLTWKFNVKTTPLYSDFQYMKKQGKL